MNSNHKLDHGFLGIILKGLNELSQKVHTDWKEKSSERSFIHSKSRGGVGASKLYVGKLINGTKVSELDTNAYGNLVYDKNCMLK